MLLKILRYLFYDKLSKDIQNALEEKEREEHTRLKIIKRTKEKQG